jgi:hypothetical protein
MALPIYGQQKKLQKNKKDDILQRVKEINSLLQYYDTLSPFSGNVNNVDLIDSNGNRIQTQLLKLLSDKKIINYPLETQLDQSELSITKSNDNKLFFFSMDEKTSGSYRTNITIIHYRLSNGTVKAETFREKRCEPALLLDSLNQKYLAIGSVQTRITCNASEAITIQLDTSSHQTELITQYDGRYDDLKVFEYNPIEKTFSYEYNAADYEDSLYGGDNDSEKLQHKFKGNLKLINGAILEIEKCELWEMNE